MQARGYDGRMSLLEQVRKAIKESGVSRYAISKATGIDQGHLSKLVHGKAGIGLDHLEKLAEFLGWDLIFRPKRGKWNGKHIHK